MPLALALPESPLAATLLLLALLAVTYALLTVFIRVGVPASGRIREPEEATDARDPKYAQETVPTDEELFAGSSEAPEPEERLEVVREPLAIETVRVRDMRISLGDTASHVMAAFRPGDGETVPMVQRDAGGMASYVSRTYRIGRRSITIVLERDDADDPLRLVRIEIGS